MGTFAALRPQLRSGDLLFFREHTFWAKIIRAFTRSDYCHVGVVWLDQDEPWILEARFAQGVSKRRLEDALPCDWIATGCNWTPEVEASALSKLGTRYSIFAAIAHGLGINPPVNTNDCSLFGAHTVAPGLGFDVIEKGMTPGHLAEIFVDAGCSIRALN